MHAPAQRGCGAGCQETAGDATDATGAYLSECRPFCIHVHACKISQFSAARTAAQDALIQSRRISRTASPEIDPFQPFCPTSSVERRGRCSNELQSSDRTERVSLSSAVVSDRAGTYSGRCAAITVAISLIANSSSRSCSALKSTIPPLVHA
jgi:hypothetical protein